MQIDTQSRKTYVGDDYKPIQDSYADYGVKQVEVSGDVSNLVELDSALRKKFSHMLGWSSAGYCELCAVRPMKNGNHLVIFRERYPLGD